MLERKRDRTEERSGEGLFLQVVWNGEREWELFIQRLEITTHRCVQMFVTCDAKGVTKKKDQWGKGFM